MPLCCEIRSGTKRIVLVPSVVIKAPSLWLFAILPFGVDESVRKVQALPIFQAAHSSRPPPLYLFYSILLI